MRNKGKFEEVCLDVSCGSMPTDHPQRKYALKALLDVLVPSFEKFAAEKGTTLFLTQPFAPDEYQRRLQETREHIRNKTGPFADLGSELDDSPPPDPSTL